MHFLAPGLQGCNFLLLVAFIPLHQVFGCNPAAGVFPIKSHQQSPRSERQHNVRPGGPQAQVKGPHQCRPRTVTSKLHRQMNTRNMYTGSKSAGGFTSVMYAEEAPQQAAGVCSFCKAGPLSGTAHRGWLTTMLFQDVVASIHAVLHSPHLDPHWLPNRQRLALGSSHLAEHPVKFRACRAQSAKQPKTQQNRTEHNTGSFSMDAKHSVTVLFFCLCINKI